MSTADDYRWAKGEMQRLETSKRQVIVELAARLEKSGMPVESICDDISNNLSREGYASDRYVRDVLSGTKYKRKYENKIPEDNGTSSELEKQKAEEKGYAKIMVSNTGRQVTSRPREDKFVSFSDFVGLARAIEDRDKTIKGLKKDKEGMQKQIVCEANLELPNSKVVENLKQELEGANLEIEFLKGQLGEKSMMASAGKKDDVAQAGRYYWKNIELKELESKIKTLKTRGIDRVEVFMRLLGGKK